MIVGQREKYTRESVPGVHPRARSQAAKI